MTRHRRSRLDLYADVLCPWCYIGYRRLVAAVGVQPDSAHVEIRWRSVELAPALSRVPGQTAAEQMAGQDWWGDAATTRIDEIRAAGAAEGLELNLHLARPVNSFDAHRLVKHAATRGRADEVVEHLLHRYHTEGRDIANHAVLEGIAVDAGLDVDGVRAVLASDAFGEDVRADEREARRRGITSVPSLVIDGQTPIDGLVDAASLRRVLDGAARALQASDRKEEDTWTSG